MQLGPTKRIPQRAAVSLSCSSRRLPSAPTSLKPAVQTMIRFVPIRPNASITGKT